MRERMWTVMARRATAAALRRAGPGGGARRGRVALVDAEGPLPEPRLDEQLAVHLADRLPGAVVVLLGVRGLRAIAWLLALPARAAGRMLRIGPAGSGNAA